MQLDLSGAFDAATSVDALTCAGRVVRMVGGLVEASGPRAAVGELCKVELLDPLKIGAPAKSAAAGQDEDEGDQGRFVSAEVVGFRQDAILLMPLTDFTGVRPGDRVWAMNRPLSVPVGESLLGRVINGLGQPLDNLGALRGVYHRPLMSAAPAPLSRRRIHDAVITGIRAIDGLMTCGRGQRLGVFAGSGIGKSVLLGSIARHAQADVNVIALIGERGREVREFLERDLADGLRKSVVVVATSDRPALVRVKGAMLALTVAEYFRDQGQNVLFMMDSLTRVATAQREIGLAAGEPPTTRGYPPSVFGQMPKLLERIGITDAGSITGLFAVLVESDDMNEPISDAARSILDGHVRLSRRLAHRSHYPAIDVLGSVSRVMPDVTTPEHRSAADRIRRVLAIHGEAEDVINLGAYVSGSNPQVDDAIQRLPEIESFLQQRPEEASTEEETLAWLSKLAAAPAVSAGTDATAQGSGAAAPVPPITVGASVGGPR